MTKMNTVYSSVAIILQIAQILPAGSFPLLSGTRSLLQPNLVLAFKYDLKGFLILCNLPVNADGVSGKFS